VLGRDEVAAREEEIRARVRRLPDRQRREFYLRAEKSLRDPDTYAVLNYLFIAGLHHFYLGKWIRGMVNISVFAVGVTLLVAGYVREGLAVIVFISVLELYALFRAPLIAQDHNNRVMERILDETDTDEIS